MGLHHHRVQGQLVGLAGAHLSDQLEQSRLIQGQGVASFHEFLGGYSQRFTVWPLNIPDRHDISPDQADGIRVHGMEPERGTSKPPRLTCVDLARREMSDATYHVPSGQPPADLSAPAATCTVPRSVGRPTGTATPSFPTMP